MDRGSDVGSIMQGLEIGKSWHRRELNAVDWGHDQVCLAVIMRTRS